MEKILSNLVLASLLGLLLSQLAAGTAGEYTRVEFVKSVSFNSGIFYAMGENGSGYLEENGTMIFRSPADAEKPLAITPGKPFVIEMATTDPQAAYANMEWLFTYGIIIGVESTDISDIRAALEEMMPVSADRANVSKACCIILRRIAPIGNDSSNRLDYLNTLALPPLSLQTQQPMEATTGAAEVPKAASILPPEQPTPPEQPKQEPSPAQASRPMAADRGIKESRAEEELQGADILPIAAAIVALALIAAMAFFVVFRGPATVMQEAPEVQQAFASETKVAILSDLRETERIPTDISARLGKSKATVSEHLEQLIAAGLVEKIETPGKKFVYYRISQKGRQALLRRNAA